MLARIVCGSVWTDCTASIENYTEGASCGGQTSTTIPNTLNDSLESGRGMLQAGQCLRYSHGWIAILATEVEFYLHTRRHSEPKPLHDRHLHWIASQLLSWPRLATTEGATRQGKKGEGRWERKKGPPPLDLEMMTPHLQRKIINITGEGAFLVRSSYFRHPRRDLK